VRPHELLCPACTLLQKLPGLRSKCSHHEYCSVCAHLDVQCSCGMRSDHVCWMCCRFKEFVQGRALHELATKEEIAALRPSVQAQAEKDAAEGVQKSAEAAAAHIERIKAGDVEATRASEAHAAAVQALQAATQASQATAAAAQQAAAGAAHPGSPQDAIAAAREAANAAATAAAEVGSKASQEATAKAAADAAAAAAAELRANAPPGTDALMRGEALPQTAPQVSLPCQELLVGMDTSRSEQHVHRDCRRLCLLLAARDLRQC